MGRTSRRESLAIKQPFQFSAKEPEQVPLQIYSLVYSLLERWQGVPLTFCLAIFPLPHGCWMHDTVTFMQTIQTRIIFSSLAPPRLIEIG